ncbi:hypothetical protein BK119_10815 [Paenibacillus peoriae]|uniref:Uncharacterized protein n=1 Tax=Paenibacillus polymyxa TaxID=1406 RepID=A0ABX2Z678_PAEPO|nr:hypothetical protein A7312_14260 [Paenibacillus polymyxa]OME70880.1 hypothetical protein BK119_10815 [Paenibacillus peoriae]
MQKVTIVTECLDRDELVRYEYDGILVGSSHALYVDPSYNVVLLERVRKSGEEYHTTGGTGSIVLELGVNDVSFIESIREMSAMDLLTKFIR